MSAGHRPGSRFVDRTAAGRVLAELLRQEYGGRQDLLVLGLPRGGVPVAAAIAADLDVGLDVLLVRKLGVPGRPELAMGAIATGGGRVRNDDVIRRLHIDEAAIDAVAAAETAELERRERAYRANRPPLSVTGRSVLLVDDGLATGASMHAAVAAVRSLQAAAVVVAVPVGSRPACRSLAAVTEAVVCALTPKGFQSVGEYYDDFGQVGDTEVRRLLGAATG